MRSVSPVEAQRLYVDGITQLLTEVYFFIFRLFSCTLTIRSSCNVIHTTNMRKLSNNSCNI